jgi:hypothetical protein
MIFLGILVLTTMVLLMRTSRYFSRPKAAEPSWSSVARKPREAGARSANIPQEMASWEVEMHEFVREIKAELDSKMRALQAVTADADRAAARLEAALRSSHREGESPVEQSNCASAARQEPRPPDVVQLFRPDAGTSKHGIDLSNLPASQAQSLTPARAPRAEHSSPQTKKDEIYTLADYGMKPTDIASRVGHPIGEVELILSLRGK